MTGWAIEIAQAALVLALAPGLVGVVRWLKARLQSRRGAPPWQPYYELRKLFGKDVIVSSNASWLFRLAPYVVFASTAAAACLVPSLAVTRPLDAVGDLLVLVYLLLLGTVFLSLAGLDPGSAFGGMGSSREMTVAALAEPTVALAIFALLGNLFVPWGVAAVAAPAPLALALGSLLLKLAVIAVVVAVLETRVAKLRLFRVPELLSVSFVLALLAVTSSFLGR